MPRPILVVQNDRDKSVGAIGPSLVRAGVSLDARSPERELPPVSSYAGLIVLPGLADPVDEDAPVQRARAAIEEALEAGLPVLGLCLGGQLLAQALGGSVYECRPELGYGPVFATPGAAGDPLFGAAPKRFSVFHAHAYAFEPPPKAEVLLTNDVCVQACRHGNAWAVQCHPEVSREWAEALAAGIRGEDRGVRAETADFFRRNGVSATQLERDAEAADPALRKVADAIGAGFAQCVSQGGETSDGAHTPLGAQRQRASSARSAG
ncbi:MAG TPA: gamma-glutamyl-gamma-aminobutyrate hydrolase family protein [Solirubrobacteraceae bacterium]|nr:gamma-glutamyl-gamma-aminobutyrate hydrolase family protein [Solirubrobacteraceae bacterium]